jgi:hypothetical protein
VAPKLKPAADGRGHLNLEVGAARSRQNPPRAVFAYLWPGAMTPAIVSTAAGLTAAGYKITENALEHFPK